MAITWEVSISNVDTVKKSADISFKRTDDVSDDIETYSFTQAIINTQAQQLALLDAVWQKHLETTNKQITVDTIISGLEDAAKINLEAREEVV